MNRSKTLEKHEKGMRGVAEGLVTLSEADQTFYEEVVERELTRLFETGEMEVIASELGVSINDAFREASHVLYAPLALRQREAEEKKRARWDEVDEVLLHEETEAHAREHGLSYGDALSEVAHRIYGGEA